MASSSPPPLVPIHGSGSDNIYYREENNSTANKLNKPIELQFDEFFNSGTHECFKIINNASSNGEYRQQQSSYHYELPCHTRTTHQLTMQSHQMEINKTTPCQSTNYPGNNPFPGAAIPDDLLFHHDSLKQDEIFSRQEIVSDVDCFWYKKNLENLNTIEHLRKEITELRTKLTAYVNHRGNNTDEKKTLIERGKFEKMNALLFKCETCRKEYKTERGLESHRNSRHDCNRTDRRLEIFKKPHSWPYNDGYGNHIIAGSRRKGVEYHASDRSLLSPNRDSYSLFPRDASQPSV